MSLSDVVVIYHGKAGFGQIVQSFTLKGYCYPPLTIEKPVSNRLSLATIA